MVVPPKSSRNGPPPHRHRGSVRFSGGFSAKGPRGKGISSVKTCCSSATRRKLLNLPLATVGIWENDVENDVENL